MQEKELKDIQIEKEEIKPSLFIHNLVMQIIPRNLQKIPSWTSKWIQ